MSPKNSARSAGPGPCGMATTRTTVSGGFAAPAIVQLTQSHYRQHRGFRPHRRPNYFALYFHFVPRVNHTFLAIKPEMTGQYS